MSYSSPSHVSYGIFFAVIYDNWQGCFVLGPELEIKVISCWCHDMEALSTFLAFMRANHLSLVDFPHKRVSTVNAFHITGPLWGEFTCHWWFPSQRVSTIIQNFDVFYVVSLGKLLKKHSVYWWFETPWDSCNVTVMSLAYDSLISRLGPIYMIESKSPCDICCNWSSEMWGLLITWLVSRWLCWQVGSPDKWPRDLVLTQCHKHIFLSRFHVWLICYQVYQMFIWAVNGWRNQWIN